MSSRFPRPTILRKRARDLMPPPNLVSYQASRGSFSWIAAARELDGLPAGGTNMAYEAVDRHVHRGRGDRVALRCVTKEGAVRSVTYAELASRSSRFAHALRALGVRPGDRVFAFLPRVLELYVACVGALKARAVFAPLLPGLGPDSLAERLRIGRARVLVTSKRLHEEVVEVARDALAPLTDMRVIVLGAAFDALLDAASSAPFSIERTDAHELALLHFTSGSTGPPKGALHTHGAVVAHHATGRLALDLHKDDVLLSTADPGAISCTAYGVVAPLTIGVTVVVDEAENDVERCYGIVREQGVTVWYTSPTLVRAMMRGGEELARRYAAPRLRFVASAGEPLDAGAVVWGQSALGRAIHDTWWQTETGAIMLANFVATDVIPGSFGRPVPGVDAAIVRRDASGAIEHLGDGVDGELALRSGWPSMFHAYEGDEQRYRSSFAGEWYLSGDVARRDADGYYWFVGRGDDLIKSFGHFVGPFEVESALKQHPSVAEAAVVGKADPVAFETVKAFVVLEPGVAPTAALSVELLAFARARLGSALAPRELEFVDALPRSPTGKLLRRALERT